MTGILRVRVPIECALRMASILFASRRYRDKDGLNGKDGRDGKDGESIIGPRGARGPQGEPGRDGAVVYLELEKIVTEIETVEVPVIEKEIFVLHVSRTETTYITPIGAVYVPENAPVVAPDRTSEGNTYSNISGRTQGSRTLTSEIPTRFGM